MHQDVSKRLFDDSRVVVPSAFVTNIVLVACSKQCKNRGHSITHFEGDQTMQMLVIWRHSLNSAWFGVWVGNMMIPQTLHDRLKIRGHEL